MNSIEKRIEDQEIVEITQFRLSEVLQALCEHYQMRQASSSTTEILSLMERTIQSSLKSETKGIPDYFPSMQKLVARMGLFVTVEYWSADLSQELCHDSHHPHTVRVFLGRLDLYDGGKDACIQALVRLQMKKAMQDFVSGLSMNQALELNESISRCKEIMEDVLGGEE